MGGCDTILHINSNFLSTRNNLSVNLKLMKNFLLFEMLVNIKL